MWLSFFPGGEVPVSSVRCSVFEKQRPDWSGAYFCGKVPTIALQQCLSSCSALKATKTKRITMYMQVWADGVVVVSSLCALKPLLNLRQISPEIPLSR